MIAKQEPKSFGEVFALFGNIIKQDGWGGFLVQCLTLGKTRSPANAWWLGSLVVTLASFAFVMYQLIFVGHSSFNPDSSLGRTMMARRFASGSAHGRQAHSRAYGREARAARCRKAAASACAGPQGRLMDYPGSMFSCSVPATPPARFSARCCSTISVKAG